ncbi:MAG: (2Fe-2S) ferredoxin domain-containing protein [Bacteroidetes bacterium]|nr:(2Fe-2S) ferredoxin domain-containing protein [Bacteroidota bacterium]
MKFEKHIFICTNERGPGQRKSCGEACGLELVQEFKKQLKEKNPGFPVRAQRAGCLDMCDYGPAMVVYPDGVFYGGVTKADIAEIIDEHIINNRPVTRLIINEESK